MEYNTQITADPRSGARVKNNVESFCASWYTEFINHCKGGLILKIQESAEDYLETILILRDKLGQVRSIDIVNEMGFSKPSISIAMRKLRENGYISMDDEGFITLTDSGLKIASTIYERHQLLTRWLIQLGVDEHTAREDACRMEHAISAESFEKIKQHVLSV